MIFRIILFLFLVVRLSAQTYSNLYTFTNGSDGSYPWSGVILSGNTLYGTTSAGTLFSIKSDGSGFNILYDLPGGGAESGVILSGDTLYGTTTDLGDVYSIKNDGSDYTNLHSFTGNSDGAYPHSGLILSGDTLYGMASEGGVSSYGGFGTIYSIKTDGSGFSVLHAFTNGTDGAYPGTSLTIIGDTLYGTAGNEWEKTGPILYGSLFSIKTDGKHFKVLHTFSGDGTGISPNSELVRSGNRFFGTESDGGSTGNGALYSINTDGSDFRTLYRFTNADYPLDGLIISKGTIYGLSANAITWATTGPTIFSVKTDGSGFTKIFTTPTGNYGYGGGPQLILSGNTFYGTTIGGTTNDFGTVYSLSLSDSISVSASPTNGGIVKGGANILVGDLATVSANPKKGYDFIYWTLGTNVVSTARDFKFTVNGNGTLIANFAKPVVVKVLASPNVGGKVTGGGDYFSGSSVSLTATSKNKYSFVNWTAGTNVISSAKDYSFIVSNNITLTANFTKAGIP